MALPREIISLSRYYGSNPEYVIAGGGNTSYKEGDSLWIKASGASLADIDESGFVCLSRKKLDKISDAVYSKNPGKREEEVKQDLKSAIIGNTNKRPSVETSLHNLLNYSYIVHTHPFTVNALLCSVKAEQLTGKLFGDEVLFVEYTDPGYILFKKTEKEVSKYIKLHSKEPSVIFLQNHGMIVCGENAGDIHSQSDRITRIVKSLFTRKLPALDFLPAGNDSKGIIDQFNRYLENRGLTCVFNNNDLIKLYVQGDKEFKRTARPFTPDNIVYCKSKYLFPGGKAEKIISDMESFESRNDYYPRIIGLEKTGLLSLGNNKQSATRSMEVFQDMMKISYLSENFGGPKFLTLEQINFIDSWEAENYRRQV
ncbi:MAG: class II aldolase/adducin family protein [Bacteroidota bacterium]|nr:class II aldolase/adducin family protein [Bacteroidota bacterium]